jgi:beta-xylosidase
LARSIEVTINVGKKAKGVRNLFNPVIWADVPDPSVIRVGDTYYMSSTTMHMNPGVPIMRSKDLANWEIVNYVYDILDDTDQFALRNGQNAYGQGSWASSLRYHDGLYYVGFTSYTTGKTYLYRTREIENGPWERSVLDGVYHDLSLLFDDDGRVYMVYGGGDIKLVELTPDATAIKEGGLNQVIIPNASVVAGPEVGLPAEGAHIHKINGRYYIFLITWPRGGIRTELCFRAERITGPYEGRVVLADAGIAQGGLIDTPDGTWYALLFGDRGAVGRIPYLVPVRWEVGWPVFGVNNKVPETLDIAGANGIGGIVRSDEFDNSVLDLVWQWNHNPENEYWSLTDRPGYLRLVNGRRSRSILEAPNILTQRTFGPRCSGEVAIEVAGMKDGDMAGLAAFQAQYGFAGVKAEGAGKYLVMVNGRGKRPVEVERVPLTQDRVCLKIACDFRNQADHAYFSYSLDGFEWIPIGDVLPMSYTIPHFMGYRFALFNYATKEPGGYLDFDYFRVNDSF